MTQGPTADSLRSLHLPDHLGMVPVIVIEQVIVIEFTVLDKVMRKTVILINLAATAPAGTAFVGPVVKAIRTGAHYSGWPPRRPSRP